jgi:hypothetical protein
LVDQHHFLFGPYTHYVTLKPVIIDHIIQGFDVVQEGLDKALHLVLCLDNRNPLFSHEDLEFLELERFEVKNKAHFASFSCPSGFIVKKELTGKKDQGSNICSIMRTGFLALLCHLMRIRFTHSWSLLVAIIILVSCNKDNREELFVINHHVDFTIQPGLNTLDTHIYAVFPIESLLDERLDDAGRTIDEVVAIESKEAILSSVFQDVNLDFIDKVSVYIFDPFNPSDKIEFFYLDPIPYKNKTTIQLFPGIADIKEWYEKEFFGVEIRLNYRQVTPSLTNMRLQFDLRVFGE